MESFVTLRLASPPALPPSGADKSGNYFYVLVDLEVVLMAVVNGDRGEVDLRNQILPFPISSGNCCNMKQPIVIWSNYAEEAEDLHLIALSMEQHAF